MESHGELPEHVRILRNETLIRARIAPQQVDYYYLHLADLLHALRVHGTTDKITVLDFGAGGSPYRTLFPNADYRTADFAGADYQIDATGRKNAPDEGFDLVLSTQVLEHCRHPERYLEEVRRVLKKSGRLLLSTHGLFEDHACPDDYFRWTADGLRAVLEQNGFEVRSMARVTAGPRAAFHLLQSALSMQLLDQRPFWARCLGRPLFRLLLARRFWNAFLDRVFPEYRVVTNGDLPLSNTYVTLLAETWLKESSTSASTHSTSIA